MEEIDIEALIMDVVEGRVNDIDADVVSDSNGPEQSVLQRAERLRTRSEEKWEKLVREAIAKVLGHDPIWVEVPHRDDIDLYYEDNAGTRHYLLRDHVSETPWQDAFDVLQKVLEDAYAPESVPDRKTRLGRILNDR